jgi:hypothetical protein
MAYGAAGPCPDFVLRPKKCKITAKIGKKLKIFLGRKTLPWTNFWKFGQKKKKNYNVNVIQYIKISDLWKKKGFQKKFIAGGFNTVAWLFGYTSQL